VTGGSARPLGATTWPPGATARRRGRGSRTGWWGRHLPGLGGSARRYRPHYRLSLGPVGSSDAAAHDWSI
jgi:hypothetical protein